jgi:hypothetical protein
MHYSCAYRWVTVKTTRKRMQVEDPSGCVLRLRTFQIRRVGGSEEYENRGGQCSGNVSHVETLLSRAIRPFDVSSYGRWRFNTAGSQARVVNKRFLFPLLALVILPLASFLSFVLWPAIT